MAGGGTRMAQAEAAGLECDKLSKSAIEAQLFRDGRETAADVGPLAGKPLVSTHIDSWEAGLGKLDGRLPRRVSPPPRLRSAALSAHAQWPGRQQPGSIRTIPLGLPRDGLRDAPGKLRRALARSLLAAKGLRLSIEAYDGTCDDLRYAGRADEPMCEFWHRGCYTGLPLCDIVEEMASAAHVYGQRILGAEAFTNWRRRFPRSSRNPQAAWATGHSAPG